MSVSVIITCFNERDYIEQAYLSIVNQTAYNKIDKIYFIDDGSTDGSLDVINNLIKSNEKVEFYQLPNVGLAKARNTALAKINAGWIAFLDGDDIWPENKVEIQLRHAAQNDSYVIYTDSYRFGKEERYIPARTLSRNVEKALADYFLNDAPILSSVMIHFDVFKELGFFDPELRVAQDTEMWTRVVSKYPTCHIKEALLFRRIHDESLGSNFDRKAKYLETVVAKITSNYPQLKKLEKSKLASIKNEHAKRYIYNQQKLKALSTAVDALILTPWNKSSLQILVIALLPGSRFWLRSLGRVRLKLTSRQASIKLEVPVYYKQ